MGLRICVAQTPTPHHLSGSSISSSLSPSTCTHEQRMHTHMCKLTDVCTKHVFTHMRLYMHTQTHMQAHKTHMCTHKPCTHRHMCMRVRVHTCTHTHVSYLGYSVLPICLPKQFSEEFPDASFYLHSFPAEYEGP